MHSKLNDYAFEKCHHSASGRIKVRNGTRISGVWKAEWSKVNRIIGQGMWSRV